MAIRRVAPQSEPIQPLERRIITLLILAVVAGGWLSIWAIHHMKEESEGRLLRTKNIWVSLQAPDAARPTGSLEDMRVRI